jgi:hypothetical protein
VYALLLTAFIGLPWPKKIAGKIAIASRLLNCGAEHWRWSLSSERSQCEANLQHRGAKRYVTIVRANEDALTAAIIENARIGDTPAASLKQNWTFAERIARKPASSGRLSGPSDIRFQS